MTAIQDARFAPLLQAAAGAAKEAARAGNDDSQERFLKLLIAQLKNQDPLDPLDNAQVTTQMAQLNMVSGIARLNATLEALAVNLSASQSMQAAALIGRGALVTGSRLALAGGEAVFGVDLPQTVDSLIVTIQDAAGRAVQSMDLGPHPGGVVVLRWDGLADGGGRAPDGAYSFTLTAASGGKRVDVRPLSYGRITGVAPGANGVELTLDGERGVAFADLKQII